MELKWLEDLLVLLEEGSISRAAARRHVTQPAYSRRIRQLEQWLGVELVDRSTKPIRIRSADMGIAWLAEEITRQELDDQRLVSYADQLGQVELDIVLYYRDEALSARVGEVIADMGSPR